MKKGTFIKKDLIPVIENYCTRNLNRIFILALILATIVSFFMLDLKMSTGGDDAAYIMRAFDFINRGQFPGYQGPLYPIVLSPFVLLFGINLPVLKSLSLIFMLGSFVFLFLSFKGRIPSLILAFTLIMISINAYLLYFSSQTYSEAFFLFTQSVFIYYFFEHFIPKDSNHSASAIKRSKFLVLGLMLTILSLTKNIGYVSLVPVLLYFAIKARWRHLFYTLVSFIAVFLVFELVKRSIWHVDELQFVAQGSSFLFKSGYAESMGKADIGSFLKRFANNSGLYLSKNLMIMLGFRNEGVENPINALTIVLYSLFFLFTIIIFKKNDILVFTACYTGSVYFAIFLIIQEFWDQLRIIIPLLPLTILFVFSGIYYASRLKIFIKYQSVLIVIVAILLFFSINRSMHKTIENYDIVKNTLRGDSYYGFTPDWKNYLKLCHWASENVSHDSRIACRKPYIASIYGQGSDFFGIYKLPRCNIEDFLKTLEDKNYLIVGDEAAETNFLAGNLLYFIKPKIIRIIDIYDSDDNTSKLFNVYAFDRAALEQHKITFHQLGIKYYDNLQALNMDYDKSSMYFNFFDPDALLNSLKNNEIEYVIIANLRRFSEEKTEYTINTVRNFMFFIQIKYPKLFQQIHQVGKENNEPAVIVKVLREE